MKIATSSLQMASSHLNVTHREINESLRVWVGPRPADPTPPTPTNVVKLSPEGVAAAEGEPVASELDEEISEPRLQLIKLLVEMLTGRPARIFDSKELSDKAAPAAPAAPRPASEGVPSDPGFGIEYDYHESYSEMETTRFSASGVVNTADGREIRFELQLEMSRAWHEEHSVSLRLGNAVRKVDPLVLNFAGTAASLTNQTFSFDLTNNGQNEQIAMLASGNAYLVFDRNGDGVINNGSEMFGPSTGNGFAELAAFDNDGNGWIDENDQIWSSLQLWQPDGQGGGPLNSLSESGVGAIALARVATPFDIKGSDNRLFGQIASSGIFLHETGGAGTIQHVDLTI